MVGWSSGLGFCHCRFKSSPLREQRWLQQKGDGRREERKEKEWRKTEQQLKNPWRQDFVCGIKIKLWPTCRPRFSRGTHLHTWKRDFALIAFSGLFKLTFHLQLRQGWAWGLSWRWSPLSGWLQAGWCPSGTPVCPSLPSWHWSLQGALWPTGRSMDDSLRRQRGRESAAQTQTEEDGMWIKKKRFFNLKFFTAEKQHQ